MSGKLTIDSAGGVKMTDGARTVFEPAANMIGLLSSASDFTATISVAFPDVLKDYFVGWQWESQIVTVTTPDQMRKDNSCVSQITALPQEWEQETVLASVAKGINLSMLLVRINRIVSPSHSWGGSPINQLGSVNSWMPLTGSVLIEAELGMARAFSIYVVPNANPELPGQLRLHRQQSVSVPAGGYGAYGDSETYPSGGGVRSGGQNLYGSAPGIPIWQRDARVGTRIAIEDPNPIMDRTPNISCYPGQPEACAINDLTNYASTYQVEIIGKFGRRT